MKKLICLFVISLTCGVFAQAVSTRSYRQILAEDKAGIIDRKPGVEDERERKIRENGCWPIGISIINHVGFPSADTGVCGLRLNLIAGVNHSVYGLDIGGFANMTEYDVTAIEIAPVFNSVGDTMKGLQIGCVNVADTLSGGQLGVFNMITHGSGCQVGVVNFANALKGLQIGLLNFNEAAACECLPLVNLGF